MGVTGSVVVLALIFLTCTAFFGAAGTRLVTRVVFGETILATFGDPADLLTSLGFVEVLSTFGLAAEPSVRIVFSKRQPSSDR